MQVLCDDSRPPLPEPPYLHLSLAGRNILRNFNRRSWGHCYSPPHRFTCSYVFLSVYLSMTLCLLRFCLPLFMLSLSLGLFFSLSVSFCLCHPHHYQCPAGQDNWWPLRSTHVPIRQFQKLFVKEVDWIFFPQSSPKSKEHFNLLPVELWKAQISLAFSKTSDLETLPLLIYMQTPHQSPSTGTWSM